jgi:hypothetical protein
LILSAPARFSQHEKFSVEEVTRNLVVHLYRIAEGKEAADKRGCAQIKRQIRQSNHQSARIRVYLRLSLFLSVHLL